MQKCVLIMDFIETVLNRSYYAVFYGVRAVLALESIDFKRHKDVVAYFNKEFVATGKFPGEMGRRLARLKMKREESDYNDFFIASADEAKSTDGVCRIYTAINKEISGMA